MSVTYQIYPIYLGENPVHDKSSFTYMVDPGVKMTCPFISFLLLGSNGRKILVDTGPCDAEWGAKCHMPLNIPDGCEIVEVLRRDFGLAPADLDYIINTHLHWDHSCGNHKFPGKKIYVQASELAYALDPLPIHRATYESPQFPAPRHSVRRTLSAPRRPGPPFQAGKCSPCVLGRKSAPSFTPLPF